MQNNGAPASRPNTVSSTYVLVSEDWWGDYAERAFNVSLISGATLNDGANKYEEAKLALKIYVPTSTN